MQLSQIPKARSLIPIENTETRWDMQRLMKELPLVHLRESGVATIDLQLFVVGKG